MPLKRTDFVNDQYPIAGNMDWLRKFADIRKLSQEIGQKYKYKGKVYKILNISPYEVVTDQGTFTFEQFQNAVYDGATLISDQPINAKENTQQIQTQGKGLLKALDQIYSNQIIPLIQENPNLSNAINQYHYTFVDFVNEAIGKISQNVTANNEILIKVAIDQGGYQAVLGYLENLYRPLYNQIENFVKMVPKEDGVDRSPVQVYNNAQNEFSSLVNTPQTENQIAAEETAPEVISEEQTAHTANSVKQNFESLYQEINSFENGGVYQQLSLYENQFPEVKEALNNFRNLKRQIDYVANLFSDQKAFQKQAQFLGNFRDKWLPNLWPTQQEKQRREQDIASNSAYQKQKDQALQNFYNYVSSNIQSQIENLLQQTIQTLGDYRVTQNKRQFNALNNIYRSLSSAQQIIQQMNLPVQATEQPQGVQSLEQTPEEQTPEEQVAEQRLENNIQAVDESRNVYESNGEQIPEVDTDSDGVPDTPAEEAPKIDTDGDGVPDAVDDDGDDVANRPAEKSGKPGKSKNNKAKGKSQPTQQGGEGVGPVAPGGAMAGREEPDINADFATIQQNIYNAILDIQQYVAKYKLSKNVKVDDVLAAINNAVSAAESMTETSAKTLSEKPKTQKTPQEPATETQKKVEEVTPSVQKGESTSTVPATRAPVPAVQAPAPEGQEPPPPSKWNPIFPKPKAKENVQAPAAEQPAVSQKSTPTKRKQRSEKKMQLAPISKSTDWIKI